jgi:hypothetical protein
VKENPEEEGLRASAPVYVLVTLVLIVIPGLVRLRRLARHVRLLMLVAEVATGLLFWLAGLRLLLLRIILLPFWLIPLSFVFRFHFNLLENRTLLRKHVSVQRNSAAAIY